MITRLRARVCASSACFAFSVCAAGATTLVDDMFTGGMGASSLSYPRWSSDGVGDLALSATSGDALRVVVSGGGNATTDRLFLRSFTETVLGEGDSLRLTLDFIGGSPGIYRMGLYDFNSGEISDGSLQLNSVSKMGYYTMFGSATFGALIRREGPNLGTTPVLVSGTTLASTSTTSNFTNSLVSVVFVITNFGTEAAPSLLLESELHSGAGGTGPVIGAYDLIAGGSPVSGVAKFDTLVFLNGGTTMTVDNVRLEYATVPEPQSYALVMGAAATALVGVVRRKRLV